jgi:hypothetical protein
LVAGGSADGGVDGTGVTVELISGDGTVSDTVGKSIIVFQLPLNSR